MPMGRHDQTHRQSRKAALCGMMAALSVVILCLGGMIPLATFACPMLAMLCLVPTVCEYGAGTAILLYGAASILALLLGPDKEITLLYVFLGWYPCVRPRLVVIPRPVRWAVKCALFTLAVVAMYALVLHLFRLEAVVEEFAGYSTAMVLALMVLGNITFLVFDQLLDRMTCAYRKKRKA
ncbi:MAG: hypothetical protein HDT35_08870 [Clostridiales bacterium]|nr:hypothetical protein [Clostridiales bacterium]